MPYEHGSKLGPIGVVFLIGILVVGGIGVGTFLAKMLAPGSLFALIIGFAMLPLCFVLGFATWYSIASALVWNQLVKAFRHALKGQDFSEAVTESMNDLPLDGKGLPGTYVFIPVSLIISLVAGILIGTTPASVGLVNAIVVMTVVGASYGVLLRYLARGCYLPIPDEA